MKYIDNIPHRIGLVILGLILFIPFLGEVHLFDWDEINFAESAREMIETGNYLQVQIDFIAFHEKPPFFIWMQALSMKIFGVTEFAARLPNALIGICSLLILYHIGKRLKGRPFGMLWALVYVSSFLPHFYFKSGLIDPTFNLLIFLSIYFFSKTTENQEFIPSKIKKRSRYKTIALSGIFMGLAILTKGPVALLLFLLTFFLFFLLTRFKKTNTTSELIFFFLITIATTSVWYGSEFYVYGAYFVTEFIQRHIELFSSEDAGHGGFPGYHFVVLLFGCFPASVFMFGGIRNHVFSTGLLHNFQKWMLALLIVVLLVFSIVQTKIIHYSSLSYFPITFFATYFLYYLLKNKRKWRWYHATIYLIVGILWGIAIIIVPLAGYHIDAVKAILIESIPNIDAFALSNLEANVSWHYWEVIYGILYVVALVVAAIFFTLKKKRFAISTLLVATCITIQVCITFFVPRIEQYTQAAAIEFIESKQTERCYIKTLGYKSYAPLFYGKKDMTLPHKTEKELLTEPINVPVYFICKNTRADKYLGMYPQLSKIGERNGFVFMEKKESQELF